MRVRAWLPWIPIVSWIQGAWITLTVGIGIAGAIVVFSPKWSFLNDLVKYGKSQSSERSIFHRSIEVPKKWFTHFYIFSTVISASITFYVWTCYYFDSLPAVAVKNFLTDLAAPYHRANVTEFSVLLTLSLLLFHTIRRLFESLFLSVYSNTKMNILHYAVGYFHYSLLPLTILSEAPGFINQFQKQVKYRDATIFQFIGLILFLFASYAQHQCLAILASMRRNYLGNITNYAHGIPVTSWFEYVSCPHFLFEILIYVSFYFTLNLTHRSWAVVVIFVVINQVLAAVITHRWYKEKYKHLYPASRAALIPYVL